MRSEHERAFDTQLRRLAPALAESAEEEHRFHPSRRWRFDFAWPDARVAVEIDGGQWARGGGRHNRDSDREKLNEAAALGWRVLRFSGQMIDRDPAGCVDALERAMGAR